MNLFAFPRMAISIALPALSSGSMFSSSSARFKTSDLAPAKSGQLVVRTVVSSSILSACIRIALIAKISQSAARDRDRAAMENEWSRRKCTRLIR